jgi:hypothetical protein
MKAINHLSELLGLPLDEGKLPVELIWKGIFELEVVRWNSRLILVGVVSKGVKSDNPLLASVTRLRSTTFARPQVVLAHQADSQRLILWTALQDGDGRDAVSDRLTDLLAVMDSLLPALPSL